MSTTTTITPDNKTDAIVWQDHNTTWVRWSDCAPPVILEGWMRSARGWWRTGTTAERIGAELRAAGITVAYD